MSAADVIRKWRQDPVAFSRECLCAEPDAWQVSVLQAAAAGNLRICLKASKGPGKSTVLSWLIWWWLVTRVHPKVVCTSISGDNLRDGLWSELAKWQNRSELLKKRFTWTAERVFANDHAETWFASARQWSKSADPSKQADTLAGIHADSVLFVVDEAGGVPDAVVAAAEAGLANVSKEAGREALLLIAGNPTELSGPLYRACTSERDLWWVKEISGDPDDPERAPRVSIEWAREQIAKYGRDNPWVLVNVFGKFPPGQSNVLLGVDEVTDATKRKLAIEVYVQEPKVFGVDVARFGDDESVLVMRQGRAVWRPKIWRNLNTMQLASRVALLIGKHKPDATFVDVCGVGAGVVDRLHELGYAVVPVDSGGKADTTEPKFLNKRAEMWWLMAQWVRAGGALPEDAVMQRELTSPTYRFGPSGELRLETKEEMKKRGVPSPNRADALSFTFAYPVASREVQNAQVHARQAESEYNPHEAVKQSTHEYNPLEG